MMQHFISLDTAIHIGYGVLFFWMFQGWTLLSELLHPEMPPRQAPGQISFALGQGMALFGLTALALLCGRTVRTTLDGTALFAIPIFVSALLQFAETAWMFAGSPNKSAPITELSFASGRNLILRNGMGLFLALGMLSCWADLRTGALASGGILVGWSLCPTFRDAAAVPSFLRAVRVLLAVFSLFTGLAILRMAVNSL